MRNVNSQRAAALLLGLFALSGAVGKETLRDPTRPFSQQLSTRSPQQKFELQAVFRSADRRVAVVNGRRVVVGDKVDGATVIAIAADSLSLEYRGARLTTRLIGTAIRK